MVISFRFLAMTLLLTVASTITAQTRWKKVNIDGICSLALPENFKDAGESFERNYNAKGSHGELSVTKLRYENVQTLTSQDLRNFYTTYADSISGNPEAIIFRDPQIKLNGLLGYRFIYIQDSISETEVDVLVVLIKDMCYTFQYSSNESGLAATVAEKKRFYTSIYLGTVKPSEQFTEELQTPSSVVGEKLGYALRYLLIGMALTIITLIVFGRFKVAASVKQVSALLFIAAGVLNLVLYIINKLMDQTQRIMFVLGLLYLVFGVVLIFVRLPKPEAEEE